MRTMECEWAVWATSVSLSGKRSSCSFSAGARMRCWWVSFDHANGNTLMICWDQWSVVGTVGCHLSGKKKRQQKIDRHMLSERNVYIQTISKTGTNTLPGWPPPLCYHLTQCSGLTFSFNKLKKDDKSIDKWIMWILWPPLSSFYKAIIKIEHLTQNSNKPMWFI